MHFQLKYLDVGKIKVNHSDPNKKKDEKQVF